jgi:hypothetical protein
MKSNTLCLLTLITLASITLSACGMYVGSPPGKTEVRESTTTTQPTPPPEVRVYNPPR